VLLASGNGDHVGCRIAFSRAAAPVLKVPKDIQFLDALPREASGNIFKRKLRDLHVKGRLRAIA